jgi:hypothetical protein
MSVVTNPTQITPAFLTSVLKAAGVLRRASVTGIDIEPLTAKTSFNAQLLRAYLTYDKQEESAPRSLVAKLPTADNELHQRAAIFRPGAKETWFYQNGAGRSPLNVPRCYFSGIDPTGESVLLLEDLAPAQTGDWVVGISVDRAELALQSLARMHAAWWATESRPEQQFGNLLDNTDEAQNLVNGLFRDAWPRFLERAPPKAPDDILEFGQYLVDHFAAAEATLDEAPHTLIHGDFRLGNILFGERQGEPTCWVIDWEDIALWSGMFDVAWFLGSCLRVADSADEQRLVRSYHEALIDAGVDGYPWTQCYHDYRCGMISAFVQGILTATVPENADEYAHDLARVIGERFILAYRRLRLHELVPL